MRVRVSTNRPGWQMRGKSSLEAVNSLEGPFRLDSGGQRLTIIKS
ncbi:MAG: hypothetical protein QOF09_4823 [Alphaproteobacteria bacterium]|jgi:hypothetical protein|nr:hypothetical protein [Alphaproteobacteria bacterium]